MSEIQPMLGHVHAIVWLANGCAPFLEGLTSWRQPLYMVWSRDGLTSVDSWTAFCRNDWKLMCVYIKMVICLPKVRFGPLCSVNNTKNVFLCIIFTKWEFFVMDVRYGCRTFFIFSVKIGSHHFNSQKSRFKRVFINGNSTFLTIFPAFELKLYLLAGVVCQWCLYCISAEMIFLS